MLNHDSEDVELAAFRFVAGDMEPDEAAAFERQLADQQGAREAVCRAIAITEKLMLLRPSRDDLTGGTVTQLSDPKTRLGHVGAAIGWMLVGAVAASLVFIVADLRQTPREDEITEQSSPGGSFPASVPAAPVDTTLVDELAWLQIDETTRWNTDLHWIGETFRPNANLPQFDLPAPLPSWQFEIELEQGENE